MTNSYNDIRNSKTMVIMGGNPAEAHPVSLQHLLEGKELQRANLHRHRSAPDPHRRACDRICAHPSRHRHPGDLRACSGTSSRTAGRTRSSSSSASTAWTTSARKSKSGTPEEVERVTGVPGEQLKRVAEMFATEKPATLIWCMGADPAHGRHRQRARVLHRAAGHRQCRRASAPAPTSSAAIATCRARPISASIS